MTLDRKLKAYVRFDGMGRVVAGSLVLRRKMPKVGHWMEIQTYECCNPTTTTTSTTSTSTTTTTTTTAIPFACTSYGVSVERGGTGTYTYTPCGELTPIGPVPIEGPLSLVMCTVTGEITFTGDVVVTNLGECETTTTTTTTTSTTTTVIP